MISVKILMNIRVSCSNPRYSRKLLGREEHECVVPSCLNLSPHPVSLVSPQSFSVLLISTLPKAVKLKFSNLNNEGEYTTFPGRNTSTVGGIDSRHASGGNSSAVLSSGGGRSPCWVTSEGGNGILAQG